MHHTCVYCSLTLFICPKQDVLKGRHSAEGVARGVCGLCHCDNSGVKGSKELFPSTHSWDSGWDKLGTEASSPYFYTPCCLGHPLHFNLHRIYPFSLSKLYTFMAPAYCAGFPLGNYDCPVRPERVIWIQRFSKMHNIVIKISEHVKAVPRTKIQTTVGDDWNKNIYMKKRHFKLMTNVW